MVWGEEIAVGVEAQVFPVNEWVSSGVIGVDGVTSPFPCNAMGHCVWGGFLLVGCSWGGVWGSLG